MRTDDFFSGGGLDLGLDQIEAEIKDALVSRLPGSNSSLPGCRHSRLLRERPR
jgi:hypothetical protein